jgi:type IV pilus assembly protein PilA
MLHKLRKRVQDEKGFTLIELLVVILIIGILAAIALPAFLGQRQKAQDTASKTQMRTMQTALETYYTDNQKYDGANLAALQQIEPTLNTTDPTPAVISAAGDTYEITSKSATGTTFTLKKTAVNTFTKTCDASGKGGCKPDGTW